MLRLVRAERIKSRCVAVMEMGLLSPGAGDHPKNTPCTKRRMGQEGFVSCEKPLYSSSVSCLGANRITLATPVVHKNLAQNEPACVT